MDTQNANGPQMGANLEWQCGQCSMHAHKKESGERGPVLLVALCI